MSELKERILEIITRPQLSGFATINEEGKPWVRYVMIVGREDMEIRFASFAAARKIKQIAANPEVHLNCGVTNPEQMNPYLQIQGVARTTTAEEERHAFWNPTLEPIFSGPDDPNLAVVIVSPYRIEYSTPGKFEPEVWTDG